MGIYKHIKELYKNPKKNLSELWKQRLIEWRRSPVIVKLDKPTRLDKARSLGYKAKKGFFVVRVRVKRGGRKRLQLKSGRRSKTQRRKKLVGKSYKWIAEERASKKYKNCEVLNSYEIAKDGIYYWFEIIMMDKIKVRTYKGYGWVGDSAGRAFRGKTSAGKKSRGLRHKGKGAEKLRPSLKSHSRKGK